MGQGPPSENRCLRPLLLQPRYAVPWSAVHTSPPGAPPPELCSCAGVPAARERTSAASRPWAAAWGRCLSYFWLRWVAARPMVLGQGGGRGRLGAASGLRLKAGRSRHPLVCSGCCLAPSNYLPLATNLWPPAPRCAAPPRRNMKPPDRTAPQANSRTLATALWSWGRLATSKLFATSGAFNMLPHFEPTLRVRVWLWGR